MANITVTINGEFTTYYQDNSGAGGLGNYTNEFEEYSYSGQWEAYRKEQYIAQGEPSDNLSTNVLNFRLEKIEEGHVERDGGFGNYNYKRRYYKYEAVVNYPDSWLDVTFKHGFIDSKAPSSQNQGGPSKEVKSLSPEIFLKTNSEQGVLYKAWPTVGEVDGHNVAYPTGIYAKSKQNKKEATTELTHLIWDWGDGTIENVALSATEENEPGSGRFVSDANGNLTYDSEGNLIFEYQKLSVGNLASPKSHTFNPDPNGNGTGKPISIRAVDGMGRKSAPVLSAIGPHIEVEKSFDETTNSIVLDLSESYGRTGKIKREFFSFTQENPNLELDENGRKWSAPLIVGGVQSAIAKIRDEHDQDYNYSAYEDKTQWDRNSYGSGFLGLAYLTKEAKWNPQRPAISVLPLRDSSSLRAIESLKLNYVSQDNSYIVSGTTSLYFIIENKKGVKNLDDLTAPRLLNHGATLYIGGRAGDGKTDLYESTNRAENWSKKAMIWTPEFYHADIVPLVGGGAASVAIKRIEGIAADGFTKNYDIELWFRKTYDLANWEDEPTQIEGADYHGLNAEDTLSFYPVLTNENLSGRPQRLFVLFGSKNYQTLDLGATWETLVI